jgi:putative copper export protein
VPGRPGGSCGRGPTGSLAIVGSSIALFGTFAWAGVQLVAGGDAWTSTPYALAALVRLLLLGGALLVARWRPEAGAAALLLALWTLALGGHATGSWLASLLIAAHLSAAAVWLGAAPAVALVLLDRRVVDDDALVVVRRFSRLAAYALVVIGIAGVLTGLILTDLLAGGILTPYVLVLGAKVLVVGGAVAMGAVGRRAIGREPRRERFRGLFLLDAGLLVAVVVLSGGLTLVGPHQGHAGHAGPSRCAATVGDASVAIILSPGRVGTNEVLVTGVSHDVQGVTLELTSGHTEEAPLEVSLGHAADGWAGTGVLPFAADWDARVVVRVDRFSEERGACRLTVSP